MTTSDAIVPGAPPTGAHPPGPEPSRATGDGPDAPGTGPGRGRR